MEELFKKMMLPSIISSIVFMILGIIIFINPEVTLEVISIVVGCMIIGFGIIGIIFYKLINGMIGIIVALIFAAIGYGIATIKIPETNNFDITRKAGGEKLDEVILRLINFKRKGKRIYVYTKEENKWED